MLQWLGNIAEGKATEQIEQQIENTFDNCIYQTCSLFASSWHNNDTFPRHVAGNSSQVIRRSPQGAWMAGHETNPGI